MQIPLSVVGVSYHDVVSYRSVVFHILSSVPCLFYHDLFWSRENFLFALFSHYSLVVHTHMGWHVWPIFSIIISFVPLYCATPFLTRVICHTYDTVYYMKPAFTSRCQSVCQILRRFTRYSTLTSYVYAV